MQFRNHKINMTPTSRKNNRGHDTATPAFTSPDGTLIRINRGGNKMQFVRDLCRNEKITHVQFRMLVPLVDMSNEGTHENPERWGKSWMDVETLAKESGCSVRAVQDNMPLLEAAGIVKVKRDLTDDGRPKGGRSNVNEYWLSGWNQFGALSDQGKGAAGAPFGEEERVRPALKRVQRAPERVRAAPEKGAHGAPDSTYLPNQEPNSFTHRAASRRETLADLDSAQVSNQVKAGNDNQPAGWPDDWRAQFWECSPERKNVAATEKALMAIGQAGVKLESILIAARRRCRTENVGYYRDPLKWLADEPWRDNPKAMRRGNVGDPWAGVQGKRVTAI